MDDPALNTRRCDETSLARLWALFLLALVLATWRLWLPVGSMPNVAMLAMPESLQVALSWASTLGIVIGCVVVLLTPAPLETRGGYLAYAGRYRIGWYLVSLSLVLAFATDQHRLQPWAYQAALYGLIFGTMAPRTTRRLLTVIGASVYIYSAVGKFDFQFAYTVGQDLLRPAIGLVGWDERLDRDQKALLALVLPAIELAGGVGVLWSVTRRVAGGVLVGMHVGLVMLLGPLGFNHSYGVVLWNVLLGVTAWWLFVRGETVDEAANEAVVWRPGSVAARWVLGCSVLAIVAPLGERAGYWDHWASWALYSPHNSRVKAQVHESAVEQLPSELKQIVEAEEPQGGWVSLDLERWSFESRGVPLYPQARYQLALAAEMAKVVEIEGDVRCLVQGVSDRWTGQREEVPLIGVAAMEHELEGYWLVP